MATAKVIEIVGGRLTQLDSSTDSIEAFSLGLGATAAAQRGALTIDDSVGLGAYIDITSGDNASAAPANTGRIVYDIGDQEFKMSANGGGFQPIPTGSTTDITITDNTTDAWQVRESTNDYFNVDTTDGNEQITLGNGTTNPDVFVAGSGLVYFDGDIATQAAILPTQDSVSGSVGRALAVGGGDGGDGSDPGVDGGTGGSLDAEAGTGGAGTGSQAAGAGGNVTVYGGQGGTDGGGGGGVGGDVEINGGPGTGSAADGLVKIGTSTTSQITFGNGGNPNFVFNGTGDILFDGDLAGEAQIQPTQDSADGSAGRALKVYGGPGGDSVASAGGTGGATGLEAGYGGAGTAGLAAGAGGGASLRGGWGGTDNGGGGGVGGNVEVTAGPGTGAAANGTVYIGNADTAQTIVGPSTAQNGTIFAVRDGTGVNYLQVDTTAAAERVIIGNATDNPELFLVGTGQVVFDPATSGEAQIHADFSAADTAGRTLKVYAGGGGPASASAGGAGGLVGLEAGWGGDGTAGLSAGAGGHLTLSASPAGTDNGGGGAAGGNVTVNAGDSSGNNDGGYVRLNAGNGAGTGVDGEVQIGYSNTAAIVLGNATDNTTITQVGTGQVTFTGNVNATAGLDVTTAALTAAAALTVTGGAFTFTGGNVDLDPTGTFALDMDAAQTATISISDNLANALLVQEGANAYLDVTTTNGGEKVEFGNATTNPDYEFLGSGWVKAKTVIFSEYANGNFGATPTLDWNNGQKQHGTLSANATFTFTAPGGHGNFTLRFTQGAGGYTVTWPSSVKWPGGTAPNLNPQTGGEINIVTFYYDGTSYYGQAALDFQ